MTNILRDYQDAVIAHNVVARVKEATEFPTPEAREKYLHSHPNADPAKHTVRKHKTPTRQRREDKGRWEDVLKKIDGLKAIGEKAKGGDEAAQKEVSERYHALASHGESIVDEATPLVAKLEGSDKLGPEGKKHLEKLKKSLGEWKSLRPRIEKAKGRNTAAQLSSANELLSVASDIRTLHSWLQNQAIKDKAMKRAAEDWKE